MSAGFSLRLMTAKDGPAIARLSDQSVDTGAVGFHNLYHYDPFGTIQALHEHACGVVVEAPDHPGIVGMGMMSVGECQYEGDLRPFAYLFSLSVHPAYRRQGIATQIAGWRIRAAREKIGPDGVIFAGIQGGNTGSLRTAARWSNQTVTGRTRVVVSRTRGHPAPSRPRQTGLQIRPAEPNDYEEIAQQQNAFYRGFNLYPLRTAEDISGWHEQAPFGIPVRCYYIASDQHGNCLAGMSVTLEGRLITNEVQRMNRTLAAGNHIFKFFPPDGKVKRLHVKDFWFAPDQQEAAAYLWETLRWQLKEHGTMMVTFIDPYSPLAPVIRVPWYMPRPNGSLVLSSQPPMSADRPLYLII